MAQPRGRHLALSHVQLRVEERHLVLRECTDREGDFGRDGQAERRNAGTCSAALGSRAKNLSFALTDPYLSRSQNMSKMSRSAWTHRSREKSSNCGKNAWDRHYPLGLTQGATAPLKTLASLSSNPRFGTQHPLAVKNWPTSRTFPFQWMSSNAGWRQLPWPLQPQ